MFSVALPISRKVNSPTYSVGTRVPFSTSAQLPEPRDSPKAYRALVLGPSLITAFSGPVLRCLGAGTTVASMIWPLFAK